MGRDGEKIAEFEDVKKEMAEMQAKEEELTE